MPRGTKIMLSFADWPGEDQKRWEQALRPTDRFEETSLGAHLAPTTRKARRESYGRFLGFISAFRPDWLSRPPEARIDRATVAEYVAWRRRSWEQSALAYDLRAPRDALKLISPNVDWSWLSDIVKRMAAGAPARRSRYHLVTSDRLYQLGVELMDGALADANAAGRTTKAHAFKYRDGLIIALLAMIPLRSRTLTALRIGQHLVKVGSLWELDIPAADTKTRRALNFRLPERSLSASICIWTNSVPGFRVRTSTQQCGRRTRATRWCPMGSILPYGNARRKRSASALISTGFVMQQQAFGRSRIQSM